MRGIITLAALPWLAATALWAQAPVITLDGDPSVQDDTIYALVVDPAAHPEEVSVLLLDDGVVRFETDGTGSRTYRMVGQVLKQDAVEQWAEHTFSYNPDRERFRLNWARVVGRDGQVISGAPMHVQESDVPAPEGSPVFTSLKRVRVSLGGVAPGTIVDYSYTVETTDPVLAGDFFQSWFINPGATIRRSRLILDVPESMEVRIHARDLDFEPKVERVAGRLVREWAKADIERVEPEPFLPDSTGFSQHILYGGPVSWARIGAWYRELAAGRYEVTPAVRSRLEELTAGLSSPEEKLRAVHRWIAQDVRYVSLSLGIGGYQPRTPDAVLSTLSGDCKDKATLFVAMARALGFEADPVLTSTGRVDPGVPSLRQFDHAIARVMLPEGPVYFDLTASLVPFGELPGMLHGGYGLVVPDRADALLVEFPDPPATESRIATRIEGRLDEAGAFHGLYHEEAIGLLQYALREGFSQALTKQQVDNVAQAVATQLFPGARGDSLEAFDGRDLSARPAMSIRLQVARATTPMPDGSHIFTLPLSSMGNLDLLRYLESRTERRAPFSIGLASGDSEQLQELVLELPEGWTAALPAPVRAESRFGTYAADYTQEGRTLRVSRRYVGGRGIAPPEAMSELIEWLRAILSDDTRYIVLKPAAGA